jgi:hypothetical protein
MWRGKKFIIIAVLTAVMLAGTIGGVALAQDNEEEAPAAGFGNVLERVCAIYEENTGVTIDQEALREAFAQAQDEMRMEALDNYLQRLVEEGKLTQEQADQYKEWLEARPDVPMVAGMGGRGMFQCFGGPGGFGPPALPEGFEPPE